MFDGSENKLLRYSNVELNTMLEVLESSNGSDERAINIGPFGVFELIQEPSALRTRTQSLETSEDTSKEPGTFDEVNLQPLSIETAPSDCSDGDISLSSPDAHTQDHHTTPLSKSKADVSHEDIYIKSGLSNPQSPGAITTIFLRRPTLLSDPRCGLYMNHWITYLSDMMLPGKFADNPYKSIFLPLVLDIDSDSASHKALLHSLCAIAAHHLATKQVIPELMLNERQKGIYHEKESIKFLSQSICDAKSSALGSSLEPTLGSIILLTLTNIFADDQGAWRTHLIGGRRLLQCFKHRLPNESTSLSKMYNMFLSLEGIGCPPIVTGEQNPMALRIVPDFSAIDITDLNYSLPELEFRMHNHAGITRPIFDIITIINQILISSQWPEESVINAIETKLYQHNPELLNFKYTNERDEAVFRVHANLFFHATSIYFRRYIRGESASDVRDQVAIAVKELRRSEELFAKTDNTNWLWPVFVIACEIVGDRDTRLVVLDWFYRNEGLGLRNIAQARQVVEKVWECRDDIDSVYCNVAWFVVMKELNLNLLLI